MTARRLYPVTVTEQGAMILWPADVDDLAFGPGLDLEQVAHIEGLITEAREQRQRWLDEQGARAEVITLDEARQACRRPHRPSERGVR